MIFISFNYRKALVRTLWLGDNVKQAIDSPRIHHQLLPMVLEYEYGNEQVRIFGEFRKSEPFLYIRR